MSLAEQYEENEQYPQAFEEYKKMHEKNPKDLSILERHGHLSILLENKDDAAYYYSKILEADMTNTLAYEQLMDIYAETDRYKYYICRGNLHTVEHKLEHAINDYKKAITSAQNDEDIQKSRFVLGTLYEQTENNLKAIDEYLKVLDYEGAFEEVYIRLAKLYVKENAPASAVEVLERAIKNGLNSTNIQELLSDMYLQNGDAEKAKKFTESLELFSLLANVADVKSLVIHPASTTHSQMSEEELLSAGITPTTVRLSIGTEHIDDIIADLEKGFEALK